MPKGVRKAVVEPDVVVDKVEGSTLLPFVKATRELVDSLDETNKKVGSDLARNKGNAAVEKIRSALTDIIEASSFDA